MGRLSLLVCVGVIFVASAVSVVIDPRGARPVEQGTRGDKCATQKEWPFCTSDEWGSKCPSGCRIQGLLDKYDHSQLRRIEKIRSLLDQNKAKHRSADQVSKQTYEYLKEKLIVDSGNDNSYFDLAQNLRQRIIDMKIKIDRQLRVLGALKERVRDQVVEMQRLEVDIDIKLRSCKGSCKSYAEYEVDRESYVELNKQVDQLAAHDAQSVETVSSLYVMKSRPLQGVLVDPKYKSGISGGSVAGQQKEDLFPEVKTVQLVLEQEGSSSSPATISKHQVCVRLGQQSQDGRQSLRPTHGYRRQQCQARSGLPLCTDDDWVSKCPSGCRLQGLISQMESELEKKMRKVCKDSETYEDASEKSMTTMTHIYNSNRKVLVNEYMSELKFVDYAEGLARNLTVLRKRSAKLSQQLKELSGNAQEQIEELYRTEVDIDMKLRACHGSCRSAVPFSVDHSSYQTLQTHMDQVDKTMNQRRKSAKPPVEIPHVKLQPVDIDVAPSAKYKSIPMVRKELLTQFEDIGQNHVVLENLLQEALDLSELE